VGPPPKQASKPAPRPPLARPRLPRKLPAWLERARRLLVQPRAEWATIAGEFATPGPIYFRYLVPMAAIGPIASTLGTLVSGGERSTLIGTYNVSTTDALASGVLEYGLNLVGVYLFAMAIEVLAATLGGQRNRVQALKVAAYASTPYWLGGVLAVLPKLAPIGALLGLYTVRLLALGLPPVMKAPRDKNAAFTLLASIVGIIVVLLTSALARFFI
jgi:hypothetical protein